VRRGADDALGLGGVGVDLLARRTA